MWDFVRALMQVYTSWTLLMPQLELQTPPSPRILCRRSSPVLVHIWSSLLDQDVMLILPKRGDLPEHPDLQLPLRRGRRVRHQAKRAEGWRVGSGAVVATTGAPTWIWSFVSIRWKFSSAGDSLLGRLHSVRHPPINKRESFQFIDIQWTNRYKFMQNRKEQLSIHLK